MATLDPKIVFQTDQLQAAFMEAAKVELEEALHLMGFCSAVPAFSAELYEMLTTALYAGSTATLKVLAERDLMKAAGS